MTDASKNEKNGGPKRKESLTTESLDVLQQATEVEHTQIRESGQSLILPFGLSYVTRARGYVVVVTGRRAGAMQN